MDLVLACIFLFVGAFICLIAELVVPAHGLMAILCALFAISGVILSFMVGTAFGLFSLFGALVLAPFLIAGFVKFYPYSPVGRRILLRGPKPGIVAGASEEQQADLAVLVGRYGVAVTTLRPSGTALIDGRRVACISEGPIIEKGTPIQALGVSGGQLLVQVLER